MKYIVITSKHHDGFCLWDSALTEFDVGSTPFKRDILGELAEACRQHGIRLCFYHSIMDWNHPDYLPRRDWEVEDRPAGDADYERFRTYLKGQVTELVEGYSPGVLWFDGEWEQTWTHEMGVDLHDHVRGLKPDILVNNRVDKGRKGMAGLTKEGDYRGDFGTPEQEIPEEGLPGVDWEACMTMNRNWGWNRSDNDWKTTEDLIRKLIDIASKGGNFLLNIGPTAEGTFPTPAVERLEGIGRWMEVNGESIHGTRASLIGRPSWGRCTWKRLPDGNTRVFLHIFDWPEVGYIQMPYLRNRVSGVTLLATGEPVDVREGEGGLVLTLPAACPDPIATVLAVEVDGQVDGD